jgi:hypothetical protein
VRKNLFGKNQQLQVLDFVTAKFAILTITQFFLITGASMERRCSEVEGATRTLLDSGDPGRYARLILKDSGPTRGPPTRCSSNPQMAMVCVRRVLSKSCGALTKQLPIRAAV